MSKVFQRFKKKKLGLAALINLIILVILCFIIPIFYPYKYDQQIKGSGRLKPFHYSEEEVQLIEEGNHIFPHILGTDANGRDYAIRVLVGGRISLSVGIVSAIIILVIGSLYGAISGYMGGTTDLLMMRFADFIYTLPDGLIIILLAQTIKFPLQALGNITLFSWIQSLGPNIVSMFLIFALLYWVDTARIVRSQIITLKENEYILAAQALGASKKRIIAKHLIPNCTGILIVTATLQIPSSIFTETVLSFLGIGVQAPMPSLGSLLSTALSVFLSYPEKLFAPAFLIFIIILTFNILGESLQEAFDPNMVLD